MLSNSEALKRYLLHLPANSQFKFTNESKRDIRKALFWAISGQGQHLEWVFPMAFQQAQQNEENLAHDVHINGAEETSTFAEAIQKIESYNWSFSEYCKTTLSKKIHNHHAFHLNSPCARIFRKGEPIYRCLTCGFDDTCALCSNCYVPEHHEGHKVHITICLRENGGVCDCGDPEAWVKEYTCPYALPKDQLQQDTEKKTPEDLKDSFLETIEILLDYIIDVMSQCDLHFENPQEMELSRIEDATQKATLDPSKYGYPDDVDTSIPLDRNSEKYYLMVYNDQIRHYRDAVQRIYHASKKVPQFAVMITEKVQNYGKAKVISSKDINLLQERQKTLSSTGLATCIRSHRDIFREDMVDEIILWIYDLTESEMFKSNNDFKNLFCRAFCGRWNSGLLGSTATNSDAYLYKVGTLDPALHIPKIPIAENDPKNKLRNFTPSLPSHWSFNPSRWELPEEICEECNYNLTEDDYVAVNSHLGSRIQYFIYLDIRFWKSIRTLLHDMYSTTLITNLQYKYIISCQYVDIYPAVADMFLTMDREPEINVMCTLSTQLFTCPTNSTSIVQHGDLSRIFASIYGFLTTDEIRSPDNIELSHEISMKSLKNRRWGQIFFDIGYILSRSKDSKTILTGSIVPMACDILALFQGRPVMKRESKNHIEYENPDYTAFFHAISVIYQFADYIASCFISLSKRERENGSDESEIKKISEDVIEYVIQFLLKLENNDYPGLIDEFVDIHLSDDKTKSITTIVESIEGSRIQKYDIDKEKVSFLHPIHSFLSWLIELSNFESASEIKNILERAQVHQEEQYQMMSRGISASTSIFEYPIRTIVLMSQIKSGFWVRNGFSVRSQLQLYRNTGLRESGYMRDLFLIQVFINTNSPNLVCFLLFNRWLLMDGWISNDKQINSAEEIIGDKTEDACAYDKNTLPYMIEECLSFFIHVLTEDLYLRNLSNEKITELRIRNEITHNLCFGPMSYTKLCAQIPDHITAEKKFDLILEDMSTFVSPSGSKDIGVYRLKEENFDQLNPYYFNYTTNTKDDAIKFVKERIHKKTGRPKSEIVIKPKFTDDNDEKRLGVYQYIGNFATSVYFHRFIIRTLEYILIEGVEKAETLLETVLHLVHICAFEKTINTSVYGSFYDIFIKKAEGKDISIGVLLYQFLCNEDFKDHHSKIRAIYNVFEKKGKYPLYKVLEVEIPNFNVWKLEENEVAASEENEYERKKRMAKERQQKLMAKFKKQQTSFLEKHKSSNSIPSSNPVTSVNSLSSAGSSIVSNVVDSNDMDVDVETDPDEAEDDQVGWKFPEPHCLLCQNAAEDAGPFGIITSISKSSEFRTVPFDNEYWFLKSFSDNSSLDIDEDVHKGNLYSKQWVKYMDQIRENNVIGPGFSQHESVYSKVVSSSCGHGMHFQCYLNYLNTSRGKSNQITRNTPENIDHKEFLCPLCKSINNMFIPILWSSNKKSLSKFLSKSDAPNPFDNFSVEKLHEEAWLDTFVNSTNKDVVQNVNLTQSAIDMVEQHSKEKTSLSPEESQENNYFRLLLSNMFQTLSSLTFPQIFKADSVAILVNTIKSTEIGLRGLSSNGGVVFSQLSNNSLINLRTWNEFRNTSLFLKAKLDTSPKLELYLKLLANLLLLSKSSFNVSIMERDFFELLVKLIPLSTSGFTFNTVLKQCFLGQIIQNINIISGEITKNTYLFQKSEESGKYNVLDIPTFEGISDEDAISCTKLFKLFRGEEGSKRDMTDTFDNSMESSQDSFIDEFEIEFGRVFLSMIVKSTTPFLRRAAIYAFVSCADTEKVEFLFPEDDNIELEADKLCKLLNIENILEITRKLLLENSFENNSLHSFILYLRDLNENRKNTNHLEFANLNRKLEYPGVVRLVDLPDRLDFFFTNYYYSDIYDNPHRRIENPAICLFCGKVIDVQKSAIGCKEGQCTTHFLKECSNNVGIFLLPKERCVLLLHKNGGSFYNAPFLDQHGELASESKRGKTLYLMRQRYNDFIKNVWLQHDIPNYVARKLDSVMDAGGWDTL